VHFSETGALFTIDLGDGTVMNIDEVKARVAARVKSVPPGEWVRGEGWDEGKLAERRHITAGDLDAVAQDNPVWLRQTIGHYGVANSYAMRLAGITRTTQAPPAGTIARNAAGNPTGVLMESAQNLVTSRIPPLTRDQQKQGLIKIIEDFNREGMTGAKDPGIDEAKWNLYQELLTAGTLTVRVFALWAGGRSLESIKQVIPRVEQRVKPPASFGDGLLFSGGVKLFMDGSGGARTAWMYPGLAHELH
jgi:predicted amidohydrolase YtcJ